MFCLWYLLPKHSSDLINSPSPHATGVTMYLVLFQIKNQTISRENRNELHKIYRVSDLPFDGRRWKQLSIILKSSVFFINASANQVATIVAGMFMALSFAITSHSTSLRSLWYVSPTRSMVNNLTFKSLSRGVW